MKKNILKFGEFIIENYLYKDISEQNENNGEIDESLIIKILDKQKELAQNKINKSGGKSLPTWIIHIESREIYNQLNNTQKEEILNNLKNKAAKLKIGSKEIEELLKKSKDGLLLNPKIIITKKSIEIPEEPNKEETKIPENEYPPISIINDDIKSNFFKDNEWEYIKGDLKNTFQENYTIDGKTISGDDVINDIINTIREYIYQDVENGGELIKEIKIASSCSRYKNTGNAKLLSWAQLGFNRAQTFVKMFRAAAIEAEADSDYLNNLKSKIKVDYLGSNGDGTSGPDPIEKNFQRGYYSDKGWIQKTGESPLDIWVATPIPSENGVKFKGEEKVKAKDSNYNEILVNPKNKKDYEEFKFIKIEIETNETKIAKKKGREPEENQTQSNTKIIDDYKYIITLYKIHKKKIFKLQKIKFPILFKDTGKNKIKKMRIIPCPKWN